MIALASKLAATAAVIVGAAMPTAHGQETFQGDLTAYTLGQTSAGNCNFMHMPAEASTKYAAINDAQWSGSMTCGRCAEVSCIDDRCADKSKKEIVYIVDRCPECKQGDLDVSPDVFKSVTGSGPSRLKTQWRFVSCPVQGNIKYCLKDGSNEYWTAVQPANAAKGVKSLTINGKTPSMVTSAYYFLIEGQGSAKADLSRLRVSVTSVDGEVIEDTVALSAGKCVEGSAQFGKGQRPAPGADEPRPTVAPYPVDPPVTPAPTPRPSNAPAPTPAKPTDAPTNAPSTPKPTDASTSAPSTLKPTDAPTSAPSPPSVTPSPPTPTQPAQPTSAPASSAPAPTPSQDDSNGADQNRPPQTPKPKRCRVRNLRA
ncbi:hypothetical protein ATCC90586_002215 [Pythium insidiosum]|nr:hypothetical protein ATCC90586_002215 [Pythium insidiosum]